MNLIRNNPHFPGKVFRRLKAGEVIKKGDYANSSRNPLYNGWMESQCVGMRIGKDWETPLFYRIVPHLSDLPE